MIPIRSIVVVALELCIIGLGYGQSASTIPETHSTLPVLVTIRTNRGDSSGSGFILEEKGAWYFATAKHVLFNRDSATAQDTLIGASAILQIPDSDPKDTTVHVVYLDLRVIRAEGRILPHKTADVAIICIGKSDSTSLKTSPGAGFISKGKNSIPVRGTVMFAPYAAVHLGNSIYVYGYPTSIGLVAMPQFDHRRPLLRKGIIAGKYDATRTIILDCPIYYGNSGGPVVEESPTDEGSKFKIVGIVTQWIPFDESNANKSTVGKGLLYTNSGYGVAESTDRVMELIP